MNMRILNSVNAQAALTKRLVDKRAAVVQNMREMCELLVRLKCQQENALWMLQYEAAGLETRKKMRAQKKAQIDKKKATEELWKSLGL